MPNHAIFINSYVIELRRDRLKLYRSTEVQENAGKTKCRPSTHSAGLLSSRRWAKFHRNILRWCIEN